MTAPDEIPIDLRDPEPRDEACIISNYLRSNRMEGSNRHLTNPEYFRVHVPLAERLARRTRIVIAANVEDPWQIYGWISFGTAPLAVHYAYTKYGFRRFGVARRLFARVNPAHLPISVTHTGRAFEAVRERYGLTFTPSLLGPEVALVPSGRLAPATAGGTDVPR